MPTPLRVREQVYPLIREHTGLSAGVHGVTGSVVGTTDTQTLTNKTLTTPTIGDFTNAQHDHTDAAGGGAISGGASDLADLDDVTITSVGDNEVLAYDSSSGDWINQTASEAGLLAASGSVTGATSSAQSFTNNVNTNGYYLIDSVRVLDNAGTTCIWVGNAGVSQSGTNCLGFGAGALDANTANYCTAIGNDAGRSNTGLSLTAFGSTAGQGNTGANVVAIGSGAGYSGDGDANLFLGANAGYNIGTGSSYNTALGFESMNGTGNYKTFNTGAGHSALYQNAGSFNVGLGQKALYTNTGGYNVAVGTEAGNANTYSYCIILGYKAVATAHRQFIVGSDDSSGYITAMYIGSGVTSANAASRDVVINATGGSGTDIGGADLTIAAGKPTGAGTPGVVNIQAAPAGSSGTTLATLATAARFDADATSGNTRFLVYDVDNATLERVSVGAADSGGTGYKVLRIPN